MAWIAPKTDWATTDGVSDDDLNRIEGNLLDLNTRYTTYPFTLTATAVAANWSGTVAPFTQTLAIAGLLHNHNGSIGVPSNLTAAQRKVVRDAIITPGTQTDGHIVLIADGVKPSVDIPVIATVTGIFQGV